MDIFFQNKYDERKIIGMTKTPEEAKKIISNFLFEHNYKSYYWRFAYDLEKQEIWIDVGSHSEFFIITDLRNITMEGFIHG